MCFLEVVLQLQSLMAKMVEKPWHHSWKYIKPIKKVLRPSKNGYVPSMDSSESSHCIQSSDPVEPLQTTSRQIPSSWLIKKKKKITNQAKNIRRVSSRRSNVLKMSSDVTVKFWGAGDYTSIKDVNQTPLKRKFEPDFEDLGRNEMTNEFLNEERYPMGICIIVPALMLLETFIE
ncbi:unnamed protein product [Lepeophtheirus salmonis]|uniref:(salmon louse) hypothetical protein n=1 Tax=Lepeophtheirus salmonis TaxID=72036 RepID=A0A7R8D0J9_LEPSM|nr:unnamed protein product [Lepeophtheirus salmonis]CAF2984472.1 unnamed protein product [Lepeophtheirus salmonis]